jgi:hypothetical protein
MLRERLRWRYLLVQFLVPQPGATGCGSFPLFTSAIADQHLAAVRLSLDNDLGKHALPTCSSGGSAGRPLIAGRRVHGDVRVEHVGGIGSGLRIESGRKAGLPLLFQRLAYHLVGESGRVTLAG